MAVVSATGLMRHGIALGMLCGLATPVPSAADDLQTQARPASAPAPSALLFDFNIAAQPLAAALDKYAALTERAAFFRSDIVAGRTSTAVQGRYTSEEALSLMVQGTCLFPEKNHHRPQRRLCAQAVGGTGFADENRPDERRCLSRTSARSTVGRLMSQPTHRSGPLPRIVAFSGRRLGLDKTSAVAGFDR